MCQEPNPPHGSVEIVQILSTKRVPQDTDASRGEQCDALSKLVINGSTGPPRTASTDFVNLVSRKDLNNLHTAVWRIRL